MSSFTYLSDIDHNDAILFLEKNNENVPNNLEGIYYKIWLMIKKGVNYYPESILEWITAANLVSSNQYSDFPEYKISVINKLSKTKLRELGERLQLKKFNSQYIINILKYMHKLKDYPFDINVDFDNRCRKRTMEEILYDYKSKITKGLFVRELLRDIAAAKIPEEFGDFYNNSTAEIMFIIEIILKTKNIISEQQTQNKLIYI